jgi:isocitrate dehydrogenase
MVIFRENTEDIYAGAFAAGATPLFARLTRAAQASSSSRALLTRRSFRKC